MIAGAGCRAAGGDACGSFVSLSRRLVYLSGTAASLSRVGGYFYDAFAKRSGAGGYVCGAAV